MGSVGRVPRGLPYERELKLTGIQPVPSVFLYVEDAGQWYVQPVGRDGRLSPWHWSPAVEVAVLSGMDIYVVEAVPRELSGESI
mgnify:CR=1 FL=1